jgi:uncharacterized protein (TIGR03083 family)
MRWTCCARKADLDINVQAGQQSARQNGHVEIAEHLDELSRQGTLLADAAGRAGLDASVPPCSPWLVKDLLRHTGYIHGWAARHIIERPDQIIDGPAEADILRSGAPDPELLDWFRAGHAALVETLTSADPAVECATFMPAPCALAFWTRRQAHETAIHRADAESAAGATPEYPAAFAADGVDELIMGFGRRRKYQPSANVDGRRMHVVATDTGDGWYIDAHEGRLQPHRQTRDDPAEAGHADCTVSGPASGVYLYLWNRAEAERAGITLTGNADILGTWQSSVRVRWG